MKIRPTFHNVPHPHRIPLTASQVVIAGYVAAIAVIEAMGIFGPMMMGIVGYALLIPLLLNHYY